VPQDLPTEQGQPALQDHGHVGWFRYSTCGFLVAGAHYDVFATTMTTNTGRPPVDERPPILSSDDDPVEITSGWPHIRRFLRVDDVTGRVDGDFTGWTSCVELRLSPVEQAAAYEEWASFWEWHLTRREPELAGDRVKRHLVATWTDSMTYSCRRSAAWARGEDPGECVPQVRRRPDLHAEGKAILADIIAELGARHRPAGYLVVAG
jgi:hypothetical protein